MPTTRKKNIEVHVTFLPVAPGSKYDPCIDNPVNMIDRFPETGYVKTYDNLIEMLKSYVSTPDETCKKMEFHFSNKNVYSFEPEKFSNGAIWGLKEKRTKDEKGKKKTKSKLFPIASAQEFDEYVKSTGEIVVDKTKNRKQPVIHHVKIELCVLLLKESLLTPSSLPGSRRDRHDSASTSTSPAKKSKVEAYFKFKATMLSIDFCSPIVTYEKADNSLATAPPSGSAKKYNIEFNLDPFIHHTTGDSNADETFRSEFSLPIFRFEMMKLVIKEFSDEYGVEKQALGPRVMFFILPNHNTSNWCEVKTTKDLIGMIKTQMSKNGRVKDGSLNLRISFGKARLGEAFQNQEALDAYLESPEEALKFSQEVTPSPPYISQAPSLMRENAFNAADSAAEFILDLYRKQDSPLYHGFLEEHQHPLYRIVFYDITKTEESVYKEYIVNDTIPPEIVINGNLLSKYNAYYLHNDTINPKIKNCPPKANTYPPTNPAVEVPPRHDDWFKTQPISFPPVHRYAQLPPGAMQMPYGSPMQIPYGSPMQMPYSSPMQMPYGSPMQLAPSLHQEASVNTGLLHGVTYSITIVKGEREQAVAIAHELSLASPMLDVIKQATLLYDNDNNENNEPSTVSVKVKNGNFKLYSFDTFKHYTASTVLRMKDLHEDSLIVLDKK